MVFKGGIPAWTKAGYALDKKSASAKTKVDTVTPLELSKILEDVYLVDVRVAHLYSKGYIPYTRAIPLDNLSDFYTEIPKDQMVVLIDHKGKQAPTAAKFLKNKGYPRVLWLKGGMNAWIKDGYGIVK